jgi:hypothetical protein
MAWHHSGFSVHAGNQIAMDDRDGQKALEEYILLQECRHALSFMPGVELFQCASIRNWATVPPCCCRS